MRDKKYYIALDDFERRVVVNCLNEMRNNLIANGKYTDAVDEILLKIIDAKQMTDIKELTPIIVNKLIERIEVHNNDKTSGHCYVKVDVYFTGVGMISIPSEEELLAMMEDIRKNPEEYRLAA